MVAAIAAAVALGSHLLGGGVAATTSSATHNWSGYNWRVKSGTGGLGQKWSPSHVYFTSSGVRIHTSGGVGGGIGMTTSKAYGTWRVRYRMTAGAGVKYGILLWPQSGSRPEIDFAEGNKHDPDRKLVTATYHPKPACIACLQFKKAVDVTKYHTAQLTWTRTGFTFYIDGVQWAHVKAQDSKPSHLSIQTWQFASGPATDLYISDVSVS